MKLFGMCFLLFAWWEGKSFASTAFLIDELLIYCLRFTCSGRIELKRIT